MNVTQRKKTTMKIADMLALPEEEAMAILEAESELEFGEMREEVRVARQELEAAKRTTARMVEMAKLAKLAAEQKVRMAEREALAAEQAARREVDEAKRAAKDEAKRAAEERAKAVEERAKAAEERAKAVEERAMATKSAAKRALLDAMSGVLSPAQHQELAALDDQEAMRDHIQRCLKP